MALDNIYLFNTDEVLKKCEQAIDLDKGNNGLMADIDALEFELKSNSEILVGYNFLGYLYTISL